MVMHLVTLSVFFCRRKMAKRTRQAQLIRRRSLRPSMIQNSGWSSVRYDAPFLIYVMFLVQLFAVVGPLARECKFGHSKQQPVRISTLIASFGALEHPSHVHIFSIDMRAISSCLLARWQVCSPLLYPATCTKQGAVWDDS